MAASSLLVTGSTTNLHDKWLSVAIGSPLKRRIDSTKLGFVSCQALGNGTLSSGSVMRSKISLVSVLLLLEATCILLQDEGSSKQARTLKQGQSVGVARCEASNEKSNSLDIWLGRAAMLGFVSVVGVEVATGKGVLENAGLVAPLPTLALALVAVVGVVTAFGIFRSGNNES